LTRTAPGNLVGPAAVDRAPRHVRLADDVLEYDASSSPSAHSSTTGDQATAARFGVDLTTDGATTPQLAISLDTRHHPEATITLSRPVTLDPAIATGEAITTTAQGALSLRGQSHRPRPVRFAGGHGIAEFHLVLHRSPR
jgi:hypothetical protein